MISWFYAFIRYTVRKYMEWKYYLKVIDLDALPSTGGLILACNHASNLDPALVGSTVTQRELYFMARSTLFDIPFLGTIIRHLNAVPIIRGAGPDQDWGFYLGLLHGGKALLIFPEGTRTETGGLQRGKSGFGRLVHMSQVPVYPVYIQGSYEAYPKHGPKKRVPITMLYGPRVEMADLLAQSDEKRNLREISERTMQAIAKLKAELEQR